ncbi:carbohydrate ABC transporter membrane protein 2, CUT1 family (TC 3.A.1.1.-) [Clostridium cavendishii DSM 21758]|uniref:Carbohydrate ABC transporter membrane protein 2, CUT1 family (TC 3.A.1.1.-) n=1 Tax=Clostridium cavendishii DSM 21758 TaxID=1121302 RepID=A0A1M6HV55_9CLOT|nr:carbohydrate ABC transporter permease [Clostridium cavendishii]SHJ26070.1 carbohydrate ABC transporter membrane protein 2, CUT1 family (TC 3.A.1.1.-) [Clostridium cavendishii DSM 21758]
MVKNRSIQIIIHIVLWIFVLMALIPFLSMFSTSLVKETFTLPYPPRIFPTDWYFGNYVEVWNSNNFFRYFINSTFLAVSTTIFVLLFSSLSAYGFSRFDFPGKEIIFNIYLFTMMVPGVLNIVAQYSVVNSLGLIDTYKGLILLAVGGSIAGNTFFLRGFFEQLPRELEESVLIDGGGRWTIYRKIILPLSKPALGTLGIGVFTGTWCDFFGVLTFIKDSDKWTLPVALQLFRGQHATSWGLVFAGAMITFIPEIIIFIVAQKYFVQSGLNDGGIKQ